MAVEVKFCGLTRDIDAAYAASLGAAYVGVIFADSSRRLEPAAAQTVLAPARGRAKAVGVFGPASAEAIADVATGVALDVLQLHGDPSPDLVKRMRSCCDAEVWAVVRIDGSQVPSTLGALREVADGVVLDAKVDGKLGGTGVAFDWEALARAMQHERAGGRLIVAGGLTPANVARAIDIIAPDVVDVSSGVERAPGIKDHARMRAFTEAVRGRGKGQ